VIEVATILDALDPIASGGAAVDPEIMRPLMRAHTPLLRLTDRELRGA
jgi:hypothetical protein